MTGCSALQVFDVRLNGHMVVKDLDIFERVGHSTAHDEIVSFSIRRGKLSVQGEVSTFNGKLTVEFVKVPTPPHSQQSKQPIVGDAKCRWCRLLAVFLRSFCCLDCELVQEVRVEIVDLALFH